ncbi:hypothetical protein O7606_13385 [Micromonospora sp. WMMD882]|uniref:hypothetical protein n=1 Tax=Micromonospora sp. WMMD882 TaxID=3015151 RepID=UPI00248CF511|nr:hypothetical protein [Micromonospora sp. WMMD882]WBB77293.1 hypothetical protein O7606_13385 [Micromonospora sp. WMMD882]
MVWELEPGRLVHDSATLPDPRDGFDDPGELAAFLDAVRWGAIPSLLPTPCSSHATPASLLDLLRLAN